MMGAPCNTLFMRCLEYLADSDGSSQRHNPSEDLNSFKPGTLANRISPDVTPQNAASNLGLFYLLKEIQSKNGLQNLNHS